MNIPKVSIQIPSLTTEQMIEVDRLMIEEFHIELIQMMENAGRCLAILARDRYFGGDLFQKPIVVLAGSGGNGGGALVAARRLANWGADVRVYLTDADHMTPIPAHQLDILHRMGILIGDANQLVDTSPKTDLILDGIIGYSLSGNPYGSAKTMIEWANAQQVPTLSLDTPSGVSLTTGKTYSPTIWAEATLTLALPKVGLFAKEVLPFRGALYLGDISVPSSLYARPSLGLEVGNIFQENDIVGI